MISFAIIKKLAIGRHAKAAGAIDEASIANDSVDRTSWLSRKRLVNPPKEGLHRGDTPC